jgi:uncharacterized lipoprotein
MFSKHLVVNVLAIFILCGCEQSAEEMSARKHAEAQSRINIQNSELKAQLRSDDKDPTTEANKGDED